MAVPPFKRYKPGLTHTGSLLASGLAAAMDLMSPATPGPNTCSLGCVDAKLHPHPWARLQAVLASSIAPPLMQLAAAQQLPRLFALWQSHDEDLVATEMSLRSSVSTSHVCAHVSGATRVKPPSPDDVPAMATAPVTEVVPLMKSCPMPQTLDGCMLYPAMSDLLVPSVPLVSLAAPTTCPSADHHARSAADQCACSGASGLASPDVTCTFSPVMPESSALPAQCCPPHTGNIVDCVNQMPVGFAMSAAAPDSSGTSVPAHNGAASMFLARPVEPPHVKPHVTPQLQESSEMPLAWPPASLSCWRRVILQCPGFVSCMHTLHHTALRIPCNLMLARSRRTAPIHDAPCSCPTGDIHHSTDCHTCLVFVLPFSYYVLSCTCQDAPVNTRSHRPASRAAASVRGVHNVMHMT